MSGRAKESYSIQTVRDAFDVLEAIGESRGATRISHLSARLGMKKAKVFRLLATFEAMGYVEQDDASAEYRLSLPTYAMGQKLLSGMGLLRQAKPLMEQLARELDEALYLAVPAAESVLMLDMVDTAQRIAVIPLLGRKYGLERTAAGRAILACRDRRDTRAAALSERERAAVREQGACWDRGALGEGIASLAVPLLQAPDTPCGALCLVVPELRWSDERLHRRFLPQLRQAGTTLSARLGYAADPLQAKVFS